MSLAPSARLGAYEVVAPIGAGGMEVYKARDTRLDRTVAIKILPAHVASDPDLRQRFEREAETLAALSHPHICPVFDVGASVPVRPEPVEGRTTAPSPADAAQPVHYLVMEYLEGETLAERLDRIRGSKDPGLPMPEALRYLIEIADALDKAHRQGIVHRDLKPGNVMLTTSGAARPGSPQAKLLDFGFAKTRSPKGRRYDPASVAQGFSPGTGGSAAPTVSTSLTGSGAIVGTLQYMAPEQLEGQEADARTDIFAFGAVRYETVTGRKAFEGKSQASLIGAIMDLDPPPISTLQPLTPAGLDRVVKRCLAKDRDSRWQTAADLLEALKWVAETPSQTAAAAPVVVRRATRERLAWMSAGVFLLALVTTLALTAAGFLDRTPVNSAHPRTAPDQ